MSGDHQRQALTKRYALSDEHRADRSRTCIQHTVISTHACIPTAGDMTQVALISYNC